MKLMMLTTNLRTAYVDGFRLEGLMGQPLGSQSLKTSGGVENTKKNLSLMTSNFFKTDRKN